MVRGLVILVVVFVVPLIGQGQSVFREGQGMWLMFFNRTEITEKWSLHTEIQDRSYDISHKEEQLLLRGGLNYHLKPRLWLTAGYGYIESYPPEGISSPTVIEHRIWQQVLHFHTLGRLFIEHRGRLEQRFVGDRYRDRLRYRLLVNVPINKERMGPKTVFASVYDEVFFHFEDSPYDRNRLYIALGYQFTRGVNVQTGWLAQNFSGKTKGYLQLGVFANVLHSKK
ncbi:MAG: DUF2490 domain-containing protein [Lunatimonas sp.]|nr:DUF2490 domain-containing protein [Lunatimonas sp.]